MNYTIQDINQLIKEHHLYQDGILNIDQLYMLLDISIKNKTPYKPMVHIQVFDDNTLSISRTFFIESSSFYMKAYALYFLMNRINKNIGFQELHKDARSNPEEYQANCFAETFTMPEKQMLVNSKAILDEWKKKEQSRIFFLRRKKMPQNEFIEEISELFSVNSTIMTNRLKQLNIIE